MGLTKSTILQRANELHLYIDSNNHVEIFLGTSSYKFGGNTLAILDSFYGPTSLEAALDKLQTSGLQNWVDTMSTINQLYQAGVLQEKSSRRPNFKTKSSGFDAAPIHISMLNDRTRTESYLKSIHQTVHPGDIVVDIGTGTGILAIAAIQAGAKHVYALEAGAMAEGAETVFQRNGLAEQITLIRGWSSQIELPERADLMISEIIGNEPLAERVLETTIDARKRLLKPDARIIPNRLKVFGLPITLPEGVFQKFTFSSSQIQEWQSWYGIDFMPLLEIAQSSPRKVSIEPILANHWQLLSEPIMLADINLNKIASLVIDNRVTAITTHSGQLDAMLTYFELELSPQTTLTTHPGRVDKRCSWQNIVWLSPQPLTLAAGELFDVTYQYGHGQPAGFLKVAKA